MNDPRQILVNKLIEKGVSSNVAYIIALDAGSSQIYVDNAYLNKFNFSESKLITVSQLVYDFYSGALLDIFYE